MSEKAASRTAVVPIKACPFCEELKQYVLTRTEPLTNLDDSESSEKVELFWVECLACDSRGPLMGSPHAAATAWNKRVSGQ